MRLLVICPHFEPDSAPTGEVMSTIVTELAGLGHEVRVVTSLPWYRRHRVEPGWRGLLVRRDRPRNRQGDIATGAEGRRGLPVRRDRPATGAGVTVTRVHPFPMDRGSIVARAVGFAGFTALATLAAAASGKRPDAVLAMAPPITLGLAGWVAARRWRAPLVFNAQDIFPDAAVEVGAIRSGRVIAAARRLERFVYHSADAVTVLSEDMRANVSAKVDPRRGTRVRVIPNFTDTARIRPAGRDTSYRAEFGLGDRTVVMYAGNVGYSQPLELLVAAARAHRHRDDVVFVVNGDGSARPALEASASGLPNLVLVGLQPPERLSEVLASADVHVIVLRAGLSRSSVPSKLYSILAAGRPVVAAVDPGSEVDRVLAEAGCGVAVAPAGADAFVAAVGSLIDDPARRAAMGESGRAFVEGWMTPTAVARAYHDLFAEVGATAPGQ